LARETDSHLSEWCGRRGKICLPLQMRRKKLCVIHFGTEVKGVSAEQPYVTRKGKVMRDTWT
jgi:hypothetical protein